MKDKMENDHISDCLRYCTYYKAKTPIKKENIFKKIINKFIYYIKSRLRDWVLSDEDYY